MFNVDWIETIENTPLKLECLRRNLPVQVMSSGSEAEQVRATIQRVLDPRDKSPPYQRDGGAAYRNLVHARALADRRLRDFAGFRDHGNQAPLRDRETE